MSKRPKTVDKERLYQLTAIRNLLLEEEVACKAYKIKIKQVEMGNIGRHVVVL